jgi:hypothetical protein
MDITVLRGFTVNGDLSIRIEILTNSIWYDGEGFAVHVCVDGKMVMEDRIYLEDIDRNIPAEEPSVCFGRLLIKDAVSSLGKGTEFSILILGARGYILNTPEVSSVPPTV